MASEKEMGKEIEEMGTDLLAGEDATRKAALNAAMKNTQTPFTAYRYPPGTPGKPNPNVICMIEKISHLPGVKSGSDYLLLVEQTLKGSPVNVTFESQPFTTSLGGVEFSQRNQSVDLGFGTVEQRTYARKVGDYVLMMTATMLSEEDNAVVDELLNTVAAIGAGSQEEATEE